MTATALLPTMRDLVEMVLGRFARPEPAPSEEPVRPQSEAERHETIEEMLLSNPACCASEFGAQWLYMKYGRG